jgi:hypothetical protein
MGEAEIAGDGQLTPPAQGEAVDGGDNRFGNIFHLGEALLGDAYEPGDVHCPLFHHLLDVRPGGEVLLPAGDDHRPHLVIQGELLRAFPDLQEKVRVQGIERRTVQGHRSHAVLNLHDEQVVVVGHFSPLFPVARRPSERTEVRFSPPPVIPGSPGVCVPG